MGNSDDHMAAGGWIALILLHHYHCTEQDVTEQGDPNRVSLRVMPTVVKMQGWFSPRSAF